MDYINLILKLIIGFSIINVWLFRFGKPTRWRGGDAPNMKEEFSVYGLPNWFMILIGTLKVVLSILLIVSIWISGIEAIAAYGIAALMLGAIFMHIKVGDPLLKSFPAFSFFVLSLFVAIF
jgi:hypothetical protein